MTMKLIIRGMRGIIIVIKINASLSSSAMSFHWPANRLFAFREPRLNACAQNNKCKAKNTFNYLFPVHQEISLC